MTARSGLVKHTTVLFLVLAVGLALVLFSVKYEVRALERELAELNRVMAADRQAIRVLEAEWSHLNEPGRLRGLSERHLGLAPVAPAQVTTLGALPPTAGASEPTP